MNHDADEVVGRITTRGQWDRRYKIVHAVPEPEREHPARLIATILLQASVLLLLFIGIGMWAWIAWAAS